MRSQAATLSTNARILIVRMGALGDIIHALPLLAALRTSRPDVLVDWLADARYAPVLALVDGLHRRVVVRARHSSVSADEVRFAGVSGVASAIRFMQAQRYEAAIDLQGLIKSAAFARTSGARRVIGFEAPQLREAAARWFYGETVHCPAPAHVIAKNLAMLEAFQLPNADREVRWRGVASRVPAMLLVEPRMARSDGFAVLNPGAAWPNKRWPPAQFGELAALLGERLNLASVITWGPGECELAGEVVAASRGHALMAPPSELHDVLALAREARLVVSGDTGPLHLAASVGAPIVGLFGPTRPERNGPGRDDDECVSRATTCGCLHKRRCLRGQACIEEIGVEEVYDACIRRISRDTAA